MDKAEDVADQVDSCWISVMCLCFTWKVFCICNMSVLISFDNEASHFHTSVRRTCMCVSYTCSLLLFSVQTVVCKECAHWTLYFYIFSVSVFDLIIPAVLLSVSLFIDTTDVSLIRILWVWYQLNYAGNLQIACQTEKLLTGTEWEQPHHLVVTWLCQDLAAEEVSYEH